MIRRLFHLPMVRATQVMRAACVLCLIALVLMAWSILDPRPLALMLAMSMGQALGILSFLLWVAAMISVGSQLSMPRSRDPGRRADPNKSPTS